MNKTSSTPWPHHDTVTRSHPPNLGQILPRPFSRFERDFLARQLRSYKTAVRLPVVLHSLTDALLDHTLLGPVSRISTYITNLSPTLLFRSLIAGSSLIRPRFLVCVAKIDLKMAPVSTNGAANNKAWTLNDPLATADPEVSYRQVYPLTVAVSNWDKTPIRISYWYMDIDYLMLRKS